MEKRSPVKREWQPKGAGYARTAEPQRTQVSACKGQDRMKGAHALKELHTEIEIQASPEKVWQVLTNLDQWPEWNPFIHHAIGRAQVGETVDITFRSASKEMTLHCTVTKAETNRELCWKYHIGLPGVLSGEHSFRVEPVGPNRVRFVDREVFKGFLVPLQAKDIDTSSRYGFEEMDKALKARAEQP